MTYIQYATYDDYGGGTGVTGSSSSIRASFSAPYVAVGFFTGSEGLPPDGRPVNSLAEFNTYVQDLEAKQTEISSNAISVSLLFATSAFVVLGGNGADVIVANSDGGFGLLVGRDGDDHLLGGGGPDTLAPGRGNDEVHGGDGSNTLSFSDAIIFRDGATGVDLDLGDAGRPVSDGVGGLVFEDIQNIIGSSGADTLTGDADANVIDGDGGDDVLTGGGGDDTASYAGAGHAVQVSLALQGAPQTTGVGSQILDGFSDVIGSAYADTLAGDGRANRIDGGAGRDTLEGGGGDDVLVGDGAGDKMLGGGGRDSFLLTAFSSEHLGTVSALGSGDVVDLTGAAASLGLSDFLAVTHFDGQAGEVRAHDRAGEARAVFRFDVDGDGAADHRLVVRGPDSSDYGFFVGVDTSGLDAGGAHDHLAT